MRPMMGNSAMPIEQRVAVLLDLLHADDRSGLFHEFIRRFHPSLQEHRNGSQPQEP